MPRIPLFLPLLLAISPLLLHAQPAPATPLAEAPAELPPVTVPELSELAGLTETSAIFRMVHAAETKLDAIGDPAERALTKTTLDEISAKPGKIKSILEAHTAGLAEIRNKVPETIFLTGLSSCKSDADIVTFARRNYAYAEKLPDPVLRRVVRFTLAKLEDRPGDVREIMKEHLRSVGARFYTAAKASVAANDAKGAIESLQVAVRSAPENLDARLLFSKILQTSLGDNFNAARILRPGLVHLVAGAPVAPEYLDRYFRLSMLTENDAETVKLAEVYLADKAFDDKARTMLATHLASALAGVGRDDEAVAVIRKYGLGKTIQGRLLEARSLFDGRRTDEADELLKKSADEFRGLERDALLSLRQKFLSDLGRYDEALAVTEQRIQEFPDRASPRIHRLWIFLRQKNEAAFRKEVAAIFKDYGVDQVAMIGLANLAAENGLTDIADDCYRKGQVSDFDRRVFALIALEARINAGKCRDALLTYESFASQDKSFFKGQEVSLNSLLTAADFGAGDAGYRAEGERRMKTLLEAKDLRPESFISTARLLGRVGRHDEAIKLLRKGRLEQPWSNRIRAELAVARIKAGRTSALPAYDEFPAEAPVVDELPAIAAGRRVAPQVWSDATDWLASDKNIPADKRRELLAITARLVRPDIVKESQRD